MASNYRKKFKKFFPLLALYAAICFNYSLLKITKDPLVITAPGSGAEILPFIKVWVILPMAFGIMFIFTRLLNRFNQERVFYIMVSGFLIFFLIFCLVLYPLRDTIHPHAFADHLETLLPAGFRGIIAIIRNWSYILFYAMSELWGTAIMNVIFWGLANEITTLNTAKNIYGYLGVGANIATILAGYIAVLFSTKRLNMFLPSNGDLWGHTLACVTITVILIGILILVLFRWYYKHVLIKEHPLDQAYSSPTQKTKSSKMGTRKNLSYLFRSKYLLSIAVLVVSFNIAINMVEILWKAHIKLVYPNSVDFNAYMGKVQIAIGILSTFIGLFLCSNLIRRIGWTLSALITPLALLITGLLFFTALLFKNHAAFVAWITLFHITPNMLGVFFGTLLIVLSRACKYTLFDTTKEITLIPLSSESKFKGKAAIDGVGSRIGKSGGSLVYQALVMYCGTVSLSTPYVGIFLLFVVGGWVFSVQSLGKKFARLANDIPDKDSSSFEAPTLEPISK